MNRRETLGALRLLILPVLGGTMGRLVATRRDVPTDTSGFDNEGRPYRGYVSDRLTRGIRKVCVDGREVKNCFAYDRKEGWALGYGASPSVDKERHALRAYKYSGDVTVEYKDGSVALSVKKQLDDEYNWQLLQMVDSGVISIGRANELFRV
jgi:hypothetical protein